MCFSFSFDHKPLLSQSEKKRADQAFPPALDSVITHREACAGGVHVLDLPCGNCQGHGASEGGFVFFPSQSVPELDTHKPEVTTGRKGKAAPGISELGVSRLSRSVQ